MKTEFPLLITFDRTDRIPYLKLDPDLTAISDSVVVKCHHVVTAEGVNDDIFAVMDWIEHNCPSGKIAIETFKGLEAPPSGYEDFHEYAVKEFDNEPPEPKGLGAHDMFMGFRIVDKVRITWTFGSDDDVILFKLRWS